jgi:hypothetical protein
LTRALQLLRRLQEGSFAIHLPVNTAEASQPIHTATTIVPTRPALEV